MSQAARPPDPDDPRRGMRVRPQRGRALFLGTFVGLIVLVFAIILLVSQCANGDGDQGGDDNATGVTVVAGDSGPALHAT